MQLTDLGCGTITSIHVRDEANSLPGDPNRVPWPFRKRVLFKVFMTHLLLQDSCRIQWISWAFPLLFLGLLLSSLPVEVQKKFLLKCAGFYWEWHLLSIWHFRFCTSSLFLLYPQPEKDFTEEEGGKDSLVREVWCNNRLKLKVKCFPWQQLQMHMYTHTHSVSLQCGLSCT